MKDRPLIRYVQVADDLIAKMGEWSDPLHVKIVKLEGDTYEMQFRRPDPKHRHACYHHESGSCFCSCGATRSVPSLDEVTGWKLP